MNLFKKFSDWHNHFGYVTTIEDLEPVKFHPKPHIYLTYYPKLRRSYFRVSAMPKPYHDERCRALWDAAHKFVGRMNKTLLERRNVKD